MEKQNIQQENTRLEVKEILFLLLDRLWLIMLAGILTAAIAFGVTKFMIVPEYEASTKVYILPREESNASVTASDLQLSDQLLGDCASLICSRSIAEEVIRTLKLDMTAEKLIRTIKVTNETNTRILNIVVSNPDPKKARDIANKVREAGTGHITDVMNLKSVNLVEEALLPAAPSSPNVLRNVLLGALLGIFGAGGVIILLFILNDKISNQDDVERYLELGVLGAIPTQSNRTKVKKGIRR